MRKFIAPVLFLTLMLPLSSCNNSDDSPQTTFIKLAVTEVDMPAAFIYGETYTIPITFQVPDGCTQFETFQIVTPSQSVREVVVIGAREETGPCTEAITEQTETLYFQVLFIQTYRFKFWQGDDANGDPVYLEIEVPVN